MSRKLLLADDSVTIQRVIELTFADEGMQVISVGDGRQAIERIEQERPDIVLADVSMPERDGYDVAAHVKRTPHLARIPVVLLTGAFEPVDNARAQEVGCDRVLAKPFEPQMVVALVRDLLEGGPQGHGVAGTPRTAGVAGGAPAATTAGSDAAAGYPFDSSRLSTGGGSLDDYFDRLDEALAGAGRPASLSGAPAPLPREPAGDQGRATAGEPSEREPAAPADPTTSASSDESAMPGAPSPAAADRPALADAFTALLAAERGEAAGATAPAARQEVGLPDAVLDELARRVAERLTDQLVREVVTERVLDVAERLVREEIERIKAQS